MRWIVLWQAKKRAAWREARLKSLEQDAMQAEMVIKRMSEFNQAADTSSGSLSSTLRNATNPSASSDDNGNNNQPIPDYTNTNDEVRLIIRAFHQLRFTFVFFNQVADNIQERIEEEEEVEGGDSPDQASNGGTGNVATSTNNGRRKKRSKKTKNR